MGKSDIEHALMAAEATLLTLKLNRQRRLHQIAEDEHNIAMLLVTITELKAAHAVHQVVMD